MRTLTVRPASSPAYLLMTVTCARSVQVIAATVRTGQRICCADREKGQHSELLLCNYFKDFIFQRALSTVLQKEYTVSSASQGRYQNRISSALPRFVRWPVRPSRKNRRKMPAGFSGKGPSYSRERQPRWEAYCC